LNTLSDRELEVFSLTGRGVGLSQLAKELGVSSKTIETHRERIKVKLQLGSTRELKEKAEQWAVKSARETLKAPSRKLSSMKAV
jgi:DNA-binding CsgD family transcriptional regulator